MTTFLIILAAFPALVLVYYVYKQDKVEKEPKLLLLKLLFLGVISGIMAIILEMIFETILSIFYPENSVIFIYINCFFVISWAEEGSKMLMLKLGSWKHKAFNYTYDGLIYAVCVSLGFALLENIEYVLDGGVGVAISRTFTAVVAHCVFGILMGMFYGKAKKYQMQGNSLKRDLNMFLTFFVPAIVHGLYDFLIMVQTVRSFLMFLCVLIMLYVFLFTFVRKESKNDTPINQVSEQQIPPVLPMQ